MNPKSSFETERAAARAALQSVLEKHEALARERAELLKLQEALTDRVAERTRNSSLTDTKVIREISEDSTRLQMVPGKLAHLDELLTASVEKIQSAIEPIRLLLSRRTGEITSAAEMEVRAFVEGRVTDGHRSAQCEEAIRAILQNMDLVSGAQGDESRVSPVLIRLSRDRGTLPRLARELVELLEKINASVPQTASVPQAA